MPALAETYSLGVPVAISSIEQELKKLWQDSAGAMTRASLMNLAVYSEEPGSLEKNTQLIAKITENHACRAIVIEADCKAKENSVDAWISAHCHVSGVGSKFALNKFHSCSKAVVQLCFRTWFSRTWIRTCRSTSGGRRNSMSR